MQTVASKRSPSKRARTIKFATSGRLRNRGPLRLQSSSLSMAANARKIFQTHYAATNIYPALADFLEDLVGRELLSPSVSTGCKVSGWTSAT